MEPLLESIRTAVAPDASVEARAAGVSACRAILAALEATEGATLRDPTSSAPRAQASVATIVSALRHASPEHLLDLAIQRLRSALPDQQLPAQPTPRFQMITIPQHLIQGGGR